MVKLYAKQVEALAYLRANDNFALFMDMRTGKTIPVLVRIAELLDAGRVEDALVVAPSAAISAWWHNVGLLEDDQRKLLTERMMVVSIDTVWRKKEFQKHWGVIVCDESHLIKHRASNRSKAMLQLALNSDYRYILTGTPVTNRKMEDIWAQFAFLDPYPGPRGQVYSNILGGSWYDFLNRYCFLNQYRQPYRYRNVSELQDIITEHSFRVTLDECFDLPKELPDYLLTVPIENKRQYRELHEESTIEEMDVLAANPLAKMTKLRQFCSGIVTNDDSVTEIPCKKAEALKEFLSGLDEKVVIFYEFNHSLESIERILLSLDILWVVLNGKTREKDVWKRFQESTELKAIVVQYRSGNAGIDLWKADTAIFYEPSLSSEVMTQARARIRKVGKVRPCQYVFLLTEHSIEMAIYQALCNATDFNKDLFTRYLSDYTKGVCY